MSEIAIRPTLTDMVYQGLTAMTMTPHFYHREVPATTSKSYRAILGTQDSAVRERFVSSAEIALDDISPSDREATFLRNLMNNNLGRPRVTISECHVVVE